MKCNAVRVLIEEIGRNQTLDSKLRSIAVAHARECRACGLQLTNERMLSAGLGMLSDEHAGQKPSRFVEAALMQAHQQRFQHKRRVFALRSFGAGLAACLGLFLLVRVGQLPSSRQSHVWAASEEISDARLAAFEVAAGENNAGKFVRIPFGETLGADERAEVQRVNTTRGALVAMGVPGAVAADPEEPVNAEIVVGEDGVARAVRILDNSQE